MAGPAHGRLTVDGGPEAPAWRLTEDDVLITAVRAQGAGGQNVNKVSSAVHLRFEIHGSWLPVDIRERLVALRDQRITAEGVVVIKAQRFRTQEANRQDALARLNALVGTVALPPVLRRATRPTAASKRRRLGDKALRGQTKAARGKVRDGTQG